jgi:glycosyltransferase involved in cell wall biosynthesis
MGLTYVLITPAYNEEEYIEKTITSMISQSNLPKIWIIVSDGSTDNTNNIVKKYTQHYDWIKLLEKSKKDDRNFANKVNAFLTGYNYLNSINYDIIGNLDADISFDSNYFEYLLSQFEKNPKLGVAGTHYIEGNFHSFHDSYINIDHVNGQCQLFRKACFDDIGGYTPIKEGGIDWVAVTTARMKGWKTHSFSKHVFYHHRKMGTAECNALVSQYNYGKKDYFLGGHPLWEIFRAIFQMTKKPYFIGGLFLFIGYLWLMIKREKRPISKELMNFFRNEQMQRLRSLFVEKFKKVNYLKHKV